MKISDAQDWNNCLFSAALRESTRPPPRSVDRERQSAKHGMALQRHYEPRDGDQAERLFADAGILAADSAEAAMVAVDRAKYCHEPDPYLDRPRRIGYNVTISAPHMHAYALSILSDQLVDGAKALDVGSGSGYLSACMAFMVGSHGRVVGIEHIPELIEISTRNVREDNPHFLKEDRIKFVGMYVAVKSRTEHCPPTVWLCCKGKR
ncbi:protein-L-isoaspartate(D-aspartate) O-methyltransferase-like isoform X4 [Temnothorax curvispinosus]|uniref:protein-L-isoaspartate(D-aspartate) O-methyltransferase n=1 Tax=Temnothorax curvispinosus TaxID=300111 RepID=A0A6J1PS37_9HYME|nr:protein-L-isoaspartate(D-aspartate) O-methyltransferase-like isoform X4 [Temnothorax curvispinosus]